MNISNSRLQYAAANGLSQEETQTGLNKLAKNELPDGANIAKVFVDGYKYWVMIVYVGYFSSAGSIGKVIGSEVIV
ncbi:hypothetical protein GTGU_04299 [Trabulsiella guamensis ATCC 49490]|uniref:Uncharacterized protein n=1 Tax=Trabulsiella guamensis ATCC 49490 TaxID=1005994 RepID=A0A084ZPA2_9ENTR|nr:hypothetical protein [Trabulsiella guamensis]KFB99296.1 hypothetical protein GTGU_04299 [Trabulsiella guamensis ATCC 49490]